MPQRVRVLGGNRPRELVTWVGNLRVSIWYRGKWRGCGLPTWERYDRSGSVPVLLEKGGGDMPVRPVAADGSSLPMSGALFGAWGKGFPLVCSWLCDASYTDGSPMGQTQLSFKREGTVVRVLLKVEDNGGIKCSALGPDPLSALAALEVLLAGPKPPWERDGYPLGNKSPQKRK